MNILFVCLGNICRSVTAEEVFRTLAHQAGVGYQFRVDSAGMIDYHEGELADSRMRACAQRRGYHLTHRSRPVRKEDFTRFDLIVAMDDNNVRNALRLLGGDPDGKLKKLMSFAGRDGNVADPWYSGDFETAYCDIETGCKALLAQFL